MYQWIIRWLHPLFWGKPFLTETTGKWFLSSLFYTLGSKNHMWIVTHVYINHMWTFTHVSMKHVSSCVTSSLVFFFQVNLFWQRSQENGFLSVWSTLVDQWIICGPLPMYQRIIRCVILCDFIPCFDVNLFWQRSQENGFSPVCWNSWRWTKDGALNIFGQKRHWYGFFFSVLTWSSEEK